MKMSIGPNTIPGGREDLDVWEVLSKETKNPKSKFKIVYVLLVKKKTQSLDV